MGWSSAECGAQSADAITPSRLLDASQHAVHRSWRDAEPTRPAKPRLIRGRRRLSPAEGRRKVFVVHDGLPRLAMLQVAACALVELPDGTAENQAGEHPQRERRGTEYAETRERPTARACRSVLVRRLLPRSVRHLAPPFCESRRSYSINGPPTRETARRNCQLNGGKDRSGRKLNRAHC